MVSSIRHYVSVAACFARLAIQRQLEYPLFLFSWLIMIPIQYFSGIWMLKIIVDRFQPLNGWDFPELTFLYGLGLISHGIFVVFFINTWHIDHMVINGQFDRLLLRPMNVFFQLVASYVNFIGVIDCIPGIIIFIYGCQLAGFEWTALTSLSFSSCWQEASSFAPLYSSAWAQLHSGPNGTLPWWALPWRCWSAERCIHSVFIRMSYRRSSPF